MTAASNNCTCFDIEKLSFTRSEFKIPVFSSGHRKTVENIMSEIGVILDCILEWECAAADAGIRTRDVWEGKYRGEIEDAISRVACCGSIAVKKSEVIKDLASQCMNMIEDYVINDLFPTKTPEVGKKFISELDAIYDRNERKNYDGTDYLSLLIFEKENPGEESMLAELRAC